MSRKFSAKSLTGLAVAAATLLAFAPFAGTANAAEENMDVTKFAKTSITINGTAAMMKNHKFAALRIGTYEKATHDGETLKSITVGTVDGIKSAATGALAAAKVADGISPSTPGSAFVGNPVGEVATNWLGYGASGDDTTSNTATAVSPSKHGYNGHLRTFVTAFAKANGIPDAVSASASTANCGGSSTDCTVDAANESAKISGLDPGIYLVEDTTSDFGGEGTGHKNSIPMLVSTGIEMNDGTKYTTFGSLTLGEVNMKSDAPSVAKTLDKDAGFDPSVGGTLHYQLKSQVPLTTGFAHYVFAMTDHPGTGLTYTDGSQTVKICPTDSINGAGCTTLAEGTDYTVTKLNDTTEGSATKGDTKYVIFDLTKSIRSQTYENYIFVTYAMSVNNNAQSEQPLRNGIRLAYSNDPGVQPGTDDPGHDPGTGNIVNCPAGTTDTNCKNGSIFDDGSGDNGGSPDADAYFRHFDLINLKKVSSTGLAGAKFTVTDNATNKLVNFYKTGNGSYKKAVEQTNTDAAKEPDGTTTPGAQLEVFKTEPAGSADSDAPTTDGQLRVDGLKDGTYTVKETVAAPGFSSSFLPSTEVTVGPLSGEGNAKKSAFMNTADTLGLIEAKGSAGNLLEVKMDNDHAVVVNNVTSISQLPLTGGAGVILGLLVLVAFGAGAGVLVFVRRRLNNA
ncbi:isopeptide-forming domain-containing fimbrial protein [Bifidobacterium sp. ESL0764]|uniref:isopeptide-forming domain-containing fimbrial protein n=1 Tax=Bifidobacterium sp. ESL0764 TaxID=2983228 RepID=UPI0023F9D349|nr:isopeptide-forming domain-containing fimbrial protein [Bifidobacterium sp. ESL0764]WEV65732.1 isopeptide-forming domain-containing fimbrial protein [Bifidobacterium sp. ESL0764]